jgi:hypothetical protein
MCAVAIQCIGPPGTFYPKPIEIKQSAEDIPVYADPNDLKTSNSEILKF